MNIWGKFKELWTNYIIKKRLKKIVIFLGLFVFYLCLFRKMRIIPRNVWITASIFVGLEMLRDYLRQKKLKIGVIEVITYTLFGLFILGPYYSMLTKPLLPTGEETPYLIGICKVSTDNIKELLHLDYLPIGQPMTPTDVTPRSLSFVEGYTYYSKGDSYLGLAIEKYRRALKELDDSFPFPASEEIESSLKYYQNKAMINLNLGFAYKLNKQKGNAIKAFHESIKSANQSILKNNDLELNKNFKGFSWSYYNLGMLSFDNKIPDEEKKGEDFLWDAVDKWGGKECNLGFYCLLSGYKNQLSKGKYQDKDIKDKISKLEKKAREKLLPEELKEFETFNKKISEVLKIMSHN